MASAAVEATPDGTKLFVGGSFNTVNGVAKQKVASLNLTTGAPLTTFGFTNSTNNQVQSLAATNSTLYVGGRYTRINGQLRTGLAAVNAASGAVDTTFVNNLSGGIGVNGQLGVPQLKLTHDNTKLLVVHTGRQIDGQDRLGMGLIDTATKELLPWRSRLWDLNLGRVGGVTRICCADIAPDDSYFVVSSGSGGDAPPISDTVIRYNLDAASLQNDDVQPVWIARHFDSIYSVAITEQAVYVGGHFQFIESPTSDDPWPGLENVGYGTGQGLAGYGLGDQVVRRDHIAALSPVSGQGARVEPDRWLELVRGQQGHGGHLARSVHRWRRDVPGRCPHRPSRVLRLQHGDLPGGAARHHDHHPDRGPRGRTTTRRSPSPEPLGWPPAPSVAFRSRSETATAASTSRTTAPRSRRSPARRTRSTRRWPVPARRAPGRSRPPITVNRNMIVSAQAFTAATGGTGDSTRATKKIESFSTDDQTPTTSISGPSGTQTSTSFTVTGTANDDKGVNSLTYWFRDEQQRYLQADGSVDDIFHTFRGEPDVVGATNATWSYEVTLAARGRLARQCDRGRHHGSGRPPQRHARLEHRLDRGRSDRRDRPAGGDDPAVRREHGDDRAGQPGDLLRVFVRRRGPEECRDLLPQQLDRPQPGQRLHLGYRHQRRQLPDLAGQHQRLGLQLELDLTGQPAGRAATASPCGPPTTRTTPPPRTTRAD